MLRCPVICCMLSVHSHMGIVLTVVRVQHPTCACLKHMHACIMQSKHASYKESVTSCSFWMLYAQLDSPPSLLPCAHQEGHIDHACSCTASLTMTLLHSGESLSAEQASWPQTNICQLRLSRTNITHATLRFLASLQELQLLDIRCRTVCMLS